MRPPGVDSLPRSPGVYLFRDGKGEVVYVGKARDLRHRVASYFQRGGLPERTRRLVEEVRAVEATLARTEVEALLLEAELIRKVRPRYNVDLKDTPRYAYLVVTREPWPRVVRAWRLGEVEGEQFGPYPSGAARGEALRSARRLFGLRTCSRMPSRACLYGRIGMCCAPCEGRVARREYLARVARARRLLRGEVGPLRRQLEREMASHSRAMRYERAAECRDRIRALDHLAQFRAASARTALEVDVVAWEVEGGACRALVMELRRGMLAGRHRLEAEGLDEEGLVSLLCQHYARAEPPARVVLARGLEGSEALGAFLARKRPAARVERADGAEPELAALAGMAERSLAFGAGGGPEHAGLLEARALLGLGRAPRAAACVDLSTHHGSAPVGAWVVFRDGRPSKGEYRRFAIRDSDGRDDLAMLAEVIRRRFTGTLAGEPAPDLLVVDGGPSQLGAAARALEGLGLGGSVELAAIAKREETVHRPGRPPVRLEPGTPASRLLTAMRDEAHRFAVSFHRMKRSRDVSSSALDAVPGVGPARRRALLRAFGSAAGVLAAPEGEVARVVGPALARRVREGLARGRAGAGGEDARPVVRASPPATRGSRRTRRA